MNNRVWLYAIQSGDRDGPVKFGITASADMKRLAELQTGNPNKLHVLATCMATRSHEGAIHALCAPERMMGEWFKWDYYPRVFVNAIALRGSGMDWRVDPLDDAVRIVSVERNLSIIHLPSLDFSGVAS